VDLSEANSKKWLPLIDHQATAQNVRTAEQSTRPSEDAHRRPHTVRQHQRRLSSSEIAELVIEYSSGATTYELASRFGCHRTTVSELLKSHDVTLRRAPLNEEQIDRAAELYETGLSLAKVGKLLSANAETVRQQLLARGVRLRGPHDPRSSS
jgi:DNA-binding CsgD family transcriptional regulator